MKFRLKLQCSNLNDAAFEAAQSVVEEMSTQEQCDQVESKANEITDLLERWFECLEDFTIEVDLIDETVQVLAVEMPEESSLSCEERKMTKADLQRIRDAALAERRRKIEEEALLLRSRIDRLIRDAEQRCIGMMYEAASAGRSAVDVPIQDDAVFPALKSIFHEYSPRLIQTENGPHIELRW